MNDILFLVDIIHMNINIFNHITKYKWFTIKKLPTDYRYKLAFLLLVLFLTMVHV